MGVLDEIQQQIGRWPSRQAGVGRGHRAAVGRRIGHRDRQRAGC